tara:strand:- start:61 stop:462 length:402 start_codon:yes stop_codon:yes gene_type:complete
MKGKEVKDKRREKEYSYDLRKKVMDFIIKEGKSQRATSRIFKISMYAINQWYQRYKKEGDYKAKKRGGSRRKFNWQDTAEYVRENPNVMLKELAKIFNVSESSIYRCLKKQGFSYKKKAPSMWKQNNAKEKYI